MTTHRYATTVSLGRLDRRRVRRTTSAGTRAQVAPVATTLDLSGDPAFRGDGTRLNPEQLLVLAASSCQLLSFLAVAARARIDVIAYHDDAIGEMPEDDHPVRITRITLRPRITVRGDVTDDACAPPGRGRRTASATSPTASPPTS